MDVWNNYPHDAVVAVGMDTITSRDPGLIDRGLMLGIKEQDLWHLFVTLMDITPIPYDGHLDTHILDAMLDSIGYLIDAYFTPEELNGALRAQIDVYSNNIINTAMAVRLTLPTHWHSFNFIDRRVNDIYIRCQVGGDPREVRNPD